MHTSECENVAKHKQIVLASWISIVSNGLLALLKISVGLWAGSLAVVGDGIDSSVDIVMSVITLFTASIIARPPNQKYAFGYNKADLIAAKALSFMIFFVGIQLGIATIKQLFSDVERQVPETYAIYVIIISIFAKLALSIYQHKVGERFRSPMLVANAKNMRSDVLISTSVLLGLLATLWLHMPIIDLLFALGVSAWIIKSGVEIFLETNTELMDGVKDPKIYDKIFRAIEKVEGVQNPHRVRSREINGLHMIVVDIEVDGNLLLHQAHHIAHEVEASIRSEIEDVYDIVVHAEPFNDNLTEESLGLTKDLVENNNT